MDANDYQRRAMSTSVKHDAPRVRLVNAIYGIVGEASEVAKIFEGSSEMQPSITMSTLDLVYSFGAYCDMIKKWLFQGHALPDDLIGLSFRVASTASHLPFWAEIATLDEEAAQPLPLEEPISEEERALLKKELGDGLWYIAQACDAAGLTLAEVMEANLEKLAKRFPNGFSNDASINREAEVYDE